MRGLGCSHKGMRGGYAYHLKSYVSGRSRPAKSGFGVTRVLPVKGPEVACRGESAGFVRQNNRGKRLK